MKLFFSRDCDLCTNLLRYEKLELSILVQSIKPTNFQVAINFSLSNSPRYAAGGRPSGFEV